MKTPKEKAKELIDKFTLINIGGYCLAKESALICVDEILETIGSDIFSEFKYWQEVKCEIKKL